MVVHCHVWIVVSFSYFTENTTFCSVLENSGIFTENWGKCSFLLYEENTTISEEKEPSKPNLTITKLTMTKAKGDCMLIALA